MSIAKTAAKILGGLILFFSLSGLIFANELVQRTEYDNLKPVVVSLFSGQMQNISDAQFAQVKSGFTLYCQQTGAQSLNLAELSSGAPNVTIRCSDIASLQQPSDFTNLMAASLFDGIYYAKYDCSLVDCVTKLPDQQKIAYIASAQANTEFKQLQMLAIVGMVIGLLLLMFAIRTPFGIAKVIGTDALASGLIGYVGLSAVKGALPAQAMQLSIISDLMAGLLNSYMIVIVAGIVLAVVGFVGPRFVGKKSKKK